MQTNAQRDEYQRNQAETIRNVLEEMLDPSTHRVTDYQTFSKAIYKELSDETTTFGRALGRQLLSIKRPSKFKAMYNYLTADTESTGRIVGYFLDKYIHYLNFDQSVNKSLTRFFNYGTMSPIENNLLTDIPYLSFPVRSINNWIQRITDPRYLRLLDDSLDGYTDSINEDGQYDHILGIKC